MTCIGMYKLECKCDHAGCDQKRDFRALNKSNARHHARKAGWELIRRGYYKGQCFCPSHNRNLKHTHQHHHAETGSAQPC